ncbi:uncharacterized protein EV420DRAFT_1607446 [Desarmillaria tabescens]|uniref:Uncharacterized protein n=1 Tax=Armillaria tabescens TaxID=1929756 RepID=A0AA39MF66_ARMTA|nr:uncharacterized protein EV420DRAFT_1607446 [Desarmillaria tabescens]KAK0432047.1 hypothetical protein EV420DRAFT_1607446 [Desarmillaria tabescens]
MGNRISKFLFQSPLKSMKLIWNGLKSVFLAKDLSCEQESGADQDGIELNSRSVLKGPHNAPLREPLLITKPLFVPNMTGSFRWAAYGLPNEDPKSAPRALIGPAPKKSQPNDTIITALTEMLRFILFFFFSYAFTLTLCCCGAAILIGHSHDTIFSLRNVYLSRASAGLNPSFG